MMYSPFILRSITPWDTANASGDSKEPLTPGRRPIPPQSHGNTTRGTELRASYGLGMSGTGKLRVILARHKTVGHS